MIKIDGTWESIENGYQARGTKGEQIQLQKRRVSGCWVLEVINGLGKKHSVGFNKHASFDHVEGVLLNWSE